MKRAWREIDRKRIYGGDYKERDEVKERTKRYKRKKAKKADAFLHKKGIQYQSQAFYSSSTGKPEAPRKAKGTKKAGQKKTRKGKK